MTIETLKSPNVRNRNSISVIKSKSLSVSSMNTSLAILKVTDARRDVILAGGLYHRFPWRHLPHPLGFLSKPLIFGFWRNAHDQYTYPLARPLMISLQVVRTSFAFHLRECMGSSFLLPVMSIMFRDKSITGIFKFPFSGGFSLHLPKMVEETLIIIIIIIIIYELIVRNYCAHKSPAR